MNKIEVLYDNKNNGSVEILPMKSAVKKIHIFDDYPPLYYRPGTSDEAIINAILIERKEYLFPNFEPKLIWDIGANIGAVTYLLRKIYPNAKIYSFEPQPDNLELLQENTAQLPGNNIVIGCGLGTLDETVRMYPSSDDTNLGGYSTKIESEKPTEQIRIFKTKKAIENFGVPDLIKIDTEGSEYDILTSFDNEQLSQIKWITGELHGVRDFELLQRLDPHFKLNLLKGFDPANWHFNALNKNWTDFGKNPNEI